MRRVDGIPITIDALASISAHLPALLKLIGESVNVEHIQKKKQKKTIDITWNCKNYL